MINRIAIIGISGAGKSTLGRVLSQRLALPLYHADAIEWLPNWVEQERELVLQQNEALIQKEKWIIEGWIDEDKVNRLNIADLVIDLDYSRWWCLRNNLRRMIKRQRRLEVPEGCIDRFDWKFLWQVAYKRERPAVDGTMKLASMKNYVRFTSPKQARKWISELGN